MKVLNLYAGIGGNRKLWEDVEVTAIESDPIVAKVYSDYFPQDTVIVGDAHQYLLDHYQEFDFIWSSPPCQTHSDTNYAASSKGKRRKAKYPDMKLYQEIILLQKWFEGLWVVENVIPYYDTLIRGREIDRHLFWSNFYIPKVVINRDTRIATSGYKEYEKEYGFDLSGYGFSGYDRRQKLRNCVHPLTGLHVFNAASSVESETVTGENLSLALASPKASTKGQKE